MNGDGEMGDIRSINSFPALESQHRTGGLTCTLSVQDREVVAEEDANVHALTGDLHVEGGMSASQVCAVCALHAPDTS